MTASLAGMAPQKRGTVPPGHLEKIEAARVAAVAAEKAYHRAAVAALVAGASYGELSNATGIGTASLQRWVAELGATPAGRTTRLKKQAERAEQKARDDAIQSLLDQGWDGKQPLAEWLATNRSNSDPA